MSVGNMACEVQVEQVYRDNLLRELPEACAQLYTAVRIDRNFRWLGVGAEVARDNAPTELHDVRDHLERFCVWRLLRGCWNWFIFSTR